MKETTQIQSQLRACLLAAVISSVDAARSGGGVGGYYYAFIIGGIVIMGVVGYFAFVWWKKKMAREQEEAQSKQEIKDAVSEYEDGKNAAFMSKYEKDLELKSKKNKLKLSVEEEAAIAHCRDGARKALMADIDDQDNKVTCNTCDAFGRTLLMIAAECGDMRIVDGLLRRGADINARNKFNGATALHFAYQYNHESLGMSLVARGADDTVRAIDGRTCYQLNEEQAADIEQGFNPPPADPLGKKKGAKGGEKKVAAAKTLYQLAQEKEDRSMQKKIQKGGVKGSRRVSHDGYDMDAAGPGGAFSGDPRRTSSVAPSQGGHPQQPMNPYQQQPQQAMNPYQQQQGYPAAPQQQQPSAGHNKYAY